jgi:CxxC-x17-CxxC domain-containing protein
MQAETGSHVILCEDCGLAALVPFKPQPGRHVFCPPCHRRRKKDQQLADRGPARAARRATPPGHGG